MIQRLIYYKKLLPLELYDGLDQGQSQHQGQRLVHGRDQVLLVFSKISN
jgi:hypothetical protein